MQDMIGQANDLTRRWITASSGDPGVRSGAGVWPLLAFLADAASGQGRSELQDAVGVPATEAAALGRRFLAELDASPAVRAALGLWTRADLTVKVSWLDKLPPGTHGTLTGTPSSDQAVLNAWASEKTDGLIDAMPVEVGADTRLVLAGALLVQTRWEHLFEDLDQPLPWPGRQVRGLGRTTPDLTELEVARTPHGDMTVLTVRGDNGIDVRLLLGEPAMTPAQVLSAACEGHEGRSGPGPGITIEEITANRPGDQLVSTLPRFSVHSRHDLLADADVFGLRTVSTHGVFPGISDTDLRVSGAAQECTATFSAEGFKAAAVTSFSMIAVGMPLEATHSVTRVSVTFDRPFGFIAVDRRTGLVLVAGWVSEPEAWSEP